MRHLSSKRLDKIYLKKILRKGAGQKQNKKFTNVQQPKQINQDKNHSYKETSRNVEFSVDPKSIFSPNGQLFPCNDKFKVLHHIEDSTQRKITTLNKYKY